MRSKKESVSILKGLKEEMASSFGVTQLGIFTPLHEDRTRLYVIVSFSDDRDLFDMAALTRFIEKKTKEKCTVISMNGLLDEITPCIMQAEPLSKAQVHFFQQEIVRLISDIELFCRGLGYEAFVSDKKTRHAVYSLLITIGRISACIPDTYKTESDGIPWALITTFPDLFSPCYGTDHLLVWNCIQNRLPAIKRNIRALLGVRGPVEKDRARHRFF